MLTNTLLMLMLFTAAGFAQMTVPPLPPITPPKYSDPLDTARKMQEIRNIQLQNARIKQEIEQRAAEQQAAAQKPGPPAPSSGPGEISTGGLLNCRAWNWMPDLPRSAYISGAIEVISISAADAFPKDADAMAQMIRKAVPYELTREETQKSVTQICSDPASAILPLVNVLGIASFKANGGTPQQVEESLADARRSWNAVLAKADKGQN